MFRRQKKRKRSPGLRMLLTRRLLIISLVVFAVMAPLSWVATCYEEVLRETNELASFSDYLFAQLEIDPENDHLLKGNSVGADGLVIIAREDESLLMSNSTALDGCETLMDCFSDGFREEILGAGVDLNGGYPIITACIPEDTVDFLEEKVESGWGTTPLRLVLADCRDGFIVVLIKPIATILSEAGSTMAWTSRSIIVSLLVSFLLTLHLLHSKVVRPITQTDETLSRIIEGDLDARATARGTREFEELSIGINTTVETLKGWIAEAETRMDAELSTARAIQEGALPQISPPYPDIPHFDIYASMTPAREVGGDFYDFFMIGKSDDHSGRLAFLVADVSSKGVPAALFMMRAKTQIRDYLESGLELGEAIENANHQLCDGNDAGMFVTAWIGILDYATNVITYVNAGHNPPLLWQRKGGWQWLRKRSGPILGCFDGMTYRAETIRCRAGDTLLLYTDGVTEAMNSDEALYGENRLLEVAERGYRLHPRELVQSVRKDVGAYAAGAEQSDDITILALEVGVPPEVTASIVVPAEVKQLEVVNSFVHTELDRRHCPLRTQNQLDIAVEELFVNVCSYAFPNGEGKVRVQCTYSAEPPSVIVELIDAGVPFNPLEKPDAVTPTSSKDVPIGGLGILMAKRCVDEMDYERIDGHNVVTVVKRW